MDLRPLWVRLLFVFTVVILQNTFLQAATKVEVAARRPTVQSTTMDNGHSSRAVDGNTNGNWSYRSCSQTSLQENPWWQVDIGTRKTVTEVVVFNYEDCCSSSLNNMEIRIGDNPMAINGGNKNPVCVSNVSMAGLTNRMFTCIPSLNGRYVIIRLIGKQQILTLCEVQVFAYTSAQSTSTKWNQRIIHTTIATVPIVTPDHEERTCKVNITEITSITENSAIVMWSRPNGEHIASVSNFQVLYKQVDNPKFTIRRIDGTRYFVHLKNLKESTEYQVEVVPEGATIEGGSSGFKTFTTSKVQKYSRPTMIQSLMKEKDFHRMLAALLGVIFLILLIVIVILCSQRKKEKPNPRVTHANSERHKTKLDNEQCKPEAGVIEEKGYVIMHFGSILDCKERDKTFPEGYLKVDKNKNQKHHKLTGSKEQLQEDIIIPTDVNSECSAESFSDACIVRLLLEEVSKNSSQHLSLKGTALKGSATGKSKRR